MALPPLCHEGLGVCDGGMVWNMSAEQPPLLTRPHMQNRRHPCSHDLRSRVLPNASEESHSFSTPFPLQLAMHKCPCFAGGKTSCNSTMETEESTLFPPNVCSISSAFAAGLSLSLCLCVCLEGLATQGHTKTSCNTTGRSTRVVTLNPDRYMRRSNLEL